MPYVHLDSSALTEIPGQVTMSSVSGWPDRIGGRAACGTNLVVKEKIRPIERFGPVSQLPCVELEPGKPPLVEPYCLTGYEPK